MKSSQNQGDILSRSMLYSGINIFGQLSQAYIQTKESGGSLASFQESIGKGSKQGGETDAGSVMNISQDVLSIFKRLQKKDSNTKIKALQELERYIESLDYSQSLLNQSMQSEDIYASQQPDETQNLLTFFLYHFCRIIMNEPDKKVRESAHTTLAAFIKRQKRRLGPHLKRIFSLWYCSFFDISQDVAQMARKNFENAFPEGKREQVFKIAYKNFLHFANEQLKQSEDQISETVADLSKAQKEDVFDRITSSVLQALAKSFDFTKDWNEEEREHFKKKLIDILDITAPLPETESEEVKKSSVVNKKQQHQSYLWGFLQPKYRGRVRASCLQFISSLLLNLPKEVIDTQISQLAPLVHNLVGEDNSQLQAILWRDALFNIGKNYPNSWEATNIKKNFLPKLYQALKASAFGSPTALYDNFVKFVSIFPLYQLVDYHEDKLNKASFKERCNLLRETLTTLYQGLKNDESVAFHQDLTKSYFETFSFMLLKRVQPLIVSESASQDDKDFAIAQMKKCVQLPLEDFINNYEKFNSRVQNQRNIRSTIPTQFSRMLKDLADRSIDERIYTSIIDFMSESVHLSLDKPNVIRIINGLLKGAMTRDTTYFNDGLVSGFIFRYAQILTLKIVEEVENLGKENIDSLTCKTLNLQRVLYKLNKFSVKCQESHIQETFKVLSEVFAKVAKKEEMAKNVLSHDILNKFKAIKDNLLKAVILTLNLEAQTLDFKTFITSILSSKSLEQSLKVKVLLPAQDLKKINFTSYYTSGLNQPAVYAIIREYVMSDIIQDDKSIGHNWALIDSGLTLIQSKNSFLLEEDQEIIGDEVLRKVKTLKSNDFASVQHYFTAVRSLVTVKSEILGELKELLFDKLLIIKSTNPSFASLWTIYSNTLKAHITTGIEKEGYFKHCIKRLKEELLEIIHQKANFSTRGVDQFDSINRFTLIVKSFVKLLPDHSSDRQHVIEEILLQEETFTSNLESNCLPLKMFRDLFLQGGLGGFDVTKLFSDNSYVWLASVLLNVRHLPSLANFLEMKKQLVIFVDTEVVPVLINQVQSGNSQLVIDVIGYMSARAKLNIDYAYSLEYVIKKMVDPGEDFPVEEKPVLKIDDFKAIFNIVYVKEQVQFTNELLLFLRVLKQISYYIMDEPVVSQLYKDSYDILNAYVKSSQQQLFTPKTAIALEIYQALHQFIGDDQNTDLTQSLLLSLLQSGMQGVDSNILNSILNFTAHSLESLGVAAFTNIVQGKINFQSFISWIIEIQRTQHLQPLTYIYMLSIIRKTINSEALITDRSLIVDQVIEIAKDHALTFDIKVNRVEKLMRQSIQVKEEKKKHVNFETTAAIEDDDIISADDEEDMVEDFEHEMLQEVAETMLALTAFVQPSINENDLYILISTGVESLQKAAFVLLKHLYVSYIPTLKFKIDEADMLKQIKQEAHESAKEGMLVEEKKGGEHFHHHDHEKYKNKLAFKNISDILIEILENPPSVTSDGQTLQQHIISGSTHVESLIFHDTHDNQSHQFVNNKTLGYFLAWNALLIKIEQGRIKSQLQGVPEYSQVLGALNEYLEENEGIYRMLLVTLLGYLPEEKRGLNEAYNVSSFEPEYMDLSEKKASSLLTVYTLLNFMKCFPSLARKYYQECDKQLLDLVMPYIKQIVSPAILENEIKKIEIAQLQLGQNELTFSLFKSTKEILANFTKGEIEMTLKIRIPADYPLKLVEVEVSRQIKISEKQLRKWILAIRKIIQFQNGDIISAVLAWKSNIEREIEGIEDCYICYCVVHENDQSLPKMPCKTCKNKFHVACIRKWFRQSHKSNCPICQSYFF